MAPNAQLFPPGSRQTTILVNNLHCPSCVANVEEALSALDPPPFNISTSIMLHEIKIIHANTLSTSQIVRALTEAAFEIDSVQPPHDAEDSDLDKSSGVSPSGNGFTEAAYPTVRRMCSATGGTVVWGFEFDSG